MGHAVAEHVSLHVRHPTLRLLLLALVVDYGDRALIGALGPTLKSVFNIGNVQLGLLAAAFSIVGAIATVPMGMLVDRVHRTTLLAVSLVLWAVAMGATGAAFSFAMFFGARVFLGIVAAITGPATPSLVGDLVPAARRGRALGAIDSGQLIGTGIGFLLAAIVASFLSYRWCFWLLGIGGLLLSVAFWRQREPKRTGAAGPSPEEVGEEDDDAAESSGISRVQELVREKGVKPSRPAEVMRDPSEMSMWDATRYVVRVRTDLVVLIARSIGDIFLAAVGTFGVIYATKQYHLSQGEADLAILVLGIGALIGVLVVGRVADLLLRRGWLTSRVWLGIIGHLLAPLPLWPAFQTHSVWIALPLFALGAFFLAGSQPPLDAVRVDVIVPLLRGRAEAIRQVLRTLVEGGAPLGFSLLAAHVGGGGDAGLRLAFLLTLFVVFANGLFLLITLRTYAPDVAAALVSSGGKAPEDQAKQAHS